MADKTLVTIHDAYGHTYRVSQSDLNGTRKMVPLYTARGKLVYDILYRDRERSSAAILRSNICPHELGTFQTQTVLGDTFRECTICLGTNRDG